MCRQNDRMHGQVALVEHLEALTSPRPHPRDELGCLPREGEHALGGSNHRGRAGTGRTAVRTHTAHLYPQNARPRRKFAGTCRTFFNRKGVPNSRIWKTRGKDPHMRRAFTAGATAGSAGPPGRRHRRAVQYRPHQRRPGVSRRARQHRADACGVPGPVRHQQERQERLRQVRFEAHPRGDASAKRPRRTPARSATPSAPPTPRRSRRSTARVRTAATPSGSAYSQKARENKQEADAKDAEQIKERKNARECGAERSADAEGFRQKYGTNANKRNAFGKCVSQKASA